MKLKTQYHHTLDVVIVDLSVVSNFRASAMPADILVKVTISHPTKYSMGNTESHRNRHGIIVKKRHYNHQGS